LIHGGSYVRYNMIIVEEGYLRDSGFQDRYGGNIDGIGSI
jgi:hypothetical protein